MTTLIENLLEQEPDKLIDSINELTDVNLWLSYAYKCNLTATKATNYDAKLEAAKAVLLIYRYLAENIDRASKDTHETSAMMFRVRMIRQLGVDTENPILNPHLIEEWFFKRLSFSIEQAVNKISNLPSKPIREIKQLRRIKNRLLVIKELRKEGYLKDNAELSKWIEISESLP